MGSTLFIDHSVDLSNTALSNVTDIIFDNDAGNVVAVFSPTQFDGTHISTSVHFTGPVTFGATAGIIVQASAATNFSAANWIFSSWGSGDTLLLNGSSSADTITGSSQNDIIQGNGGVDALAGGDGNDKFDIDGWAGGSVDGGNGTDTALIEATTADFTHSTFTNIEVIDLLNASATFTSAQLASVLTISGNAFAESLTVIGSTVDLSAKGFASWTNGQDTISIKGTTGADHLTGSGQNDIIDGGAGADTMTGGGGDDRFVFAPHDGADTVTDFTEGHDKVDLTGFFMTFGAAMSHATQSGGSTVLDFGGGDTLTLQNTVKANLNADDFVGLKTTPSDFNKDGHSDILWERADGTVSVWDSGQIGAAHYITNPGAVPSSWHIVGKGDFDDNGHEDILWQNDNGAVSIWDNGQINSAHIIASSGVVPGGWHIVGVGDFDDNGQSDILWQNDNGAVSIWDNGQIASAHIIASSGSVLSSWHIAGVGDFDGNGQSDILWQNDNGSISIWDNGQIGGAHIGVGLSPTSWHIAGVGDFDGNGHDDVLWQNVDASVSIFDDGNAAGAHLVANAGAVSASWHIAGVGDFDGNGHSDILWHNDNGAISIWDNGQIGSAHIIAGAGVVTGDWHIA